MSRIVRNRRAPVRGVAARTVVLAILLVGAGAAGARQEQPATIDQRTGSPKSTSTGHIERPEAARRVVRHFDFEEKASNPYPWPRHWLRAQDGLREREESGRDVAFNRPGFPSWNLGEIDYASPAFAGEGSVKLPTRGGSTALRLEAGVIPVFADADYLISAQVRTEGLTHARARVEARFLDSQRHPIEPSTVVGASVISEGAWTPVEIELRGLYDNAAYMEIEIQLLQPEQQGGVIPSYRPAPQDYSGAAWFDEVSVAQLPRIELTASAPGGIFLAPDRPELRLDIRDLTGEALTAQVTLIDSTGTVVDRLRKDVGAGRVRGPWSPSVPRFGWYRAALGVFNKDSLVGKAHADFLWLDADPRAAGDARKLEADRARFGLIVDPAPKELGARLEEIVRRVGTGGVTMHAWSAELSSAKVRDHTRALAALIDPLLEHGQDVTLELPRMPEELAAVSRLDPDDPWRVLAGDRTMWGPYLEPILEKFGQRVRRWQIGGVGDEHAFWSKNFGEDFAGANRALSSLVPGAVVCVPWRADRALRAPPGAGKAHLSVLVPQDSAPGSVTHVADAWRQMPAGTELEFVFEQPPEDLYGFGPGLGELAQRALEMWAVDRAPARAGESGAGERALVRGSLSSPWALGGKMGTDVLPRPELGVWSTLARHLSGRRVVGEFPAGAGMRCYILAPAPGEPEDRPGALVAWSESAGPEGAVLRAYLGPGPITVVDLFGNSSAAPKDEGPILRERDVAGGPEKPTARKPGVRIPLTSQPVFIEGVEAHLVKFLASVRIDPPLLTPTNETHEHAIVFENPWSVPLDVRSFVASPGGYETPDGARDRRWRITPRAGRVIVAPGGQGRIPMTVAFAASEEAGIKEFLLDLEVTADRNYGTIRTSTSVELGLPDIMLELAAIRDGEDLVVEARVTNRSTHPMDLELTATAPDQPRSKAPVSQLPPGTKALRRFPYSKGLEKMSGKRVSVAVLEPETGARIVRSVVIE